MTQELLRKRAERLPNESTVLPATHFVVLQVLTALILLGYTITAIGHVDATTGKPPPEYCALFSVFFTAYTVFYRFCRDLNDPFTGLYQIRRSAVSAHLLGIKYAFQSDPLVRDQMSFERVQVEYKNADES